MFTHQEERKLIRGGASTFMTFLLTNVSFPMLRKNIHNDICLNAVLTTQTLLTFFACYFLIEFIANNVERFNSGLGRPAHGYTLVEQ